MTDKPSPPDLDPKRMEGIAWLVLHTLNAAGCTRREAAAVLSAIALNHAFGTDVDPERMHAAVEACRVMRHDGVPAQYLVADPPSHRDAWHDDAFAEGLARYLRIMNGGHDAS